MGAVDDKGPSLHGEAAGESNQLTFTGEKGRLSQPDGENVNLSAQDKSPGKPDQLFYPSLYQSADERAYERVKLRLDCAADCPLYDEALDLETDGDYVGALAVLNRHRTQRCQWLSPWR